jgi:hypothetical protein
VTIRKFTGIDKRDAFSVGDGAATSMKNLTSSSPPTLTVRSGFSSIGTSFAAAILGLGVWKDTELHAIGNGTWKVWSGTAWGAALLSSISTTLPWSFCNFQGGFAAISLLGVNSALAKKYSGTTVTDLANCPAGANYIDAHDNRVYVAVASRVWASAFRDAENWTIGDLDTDAWWGEVETPDGRDIVGMRAGYQHLTVFKPYHTFELFGTGSLNYRIQPVSEKVGCVSNSSIVTVGNIQYWVSHRGIERYSGGSPPKNDFSQPVNWYIENMNQTYKSKVCSGTDGKRLYVAVPVLTATEPSHVLEYDPEFGIWCVWELGHYPRVFAYMAEEWYNGDSAGVVHLMGGDDDAGTAISWNWISKPFGSGSTTSEWFDLWAVVDVPIGSTMNIYLSGLPEGGGDWTLVKTITPSAAIQGRRVLLPIGDFLNANWLRMKLSGTGPASVYEWSRQERVLRSV